MAKSDKHRYWVFEVYPESAPEDWLKQLDDTLCPIAVGPEHVADDKEAKPHFHCIFYSPGPVRWENVKAIIPEDVPANGHIEWAKSPTGAQRYLLHLDHPDKQQFPEGPKAITLLNGFPLDLSRYMSKAELNGIRQKIHEYIREFGIVEYSELLDGLLNYDFEMYDYACNHTILFNTYISSRRNGIREKLEESE